MVVVAASRVGLLKAEDYPINRPPFFAQKYQRLMAKVCLAQQFGPAAYVLLAIIVGQEDACRYKRAVSFYDVQLMPIIGVSSRDTMTKLRKKLVRAGWLCCVTGHKGVASLYWVRVPDRYLGINDNPLEEGYDDSLRNDVQKSDTSQTENGSKTVRIRSLTSYTLNPHPHHRDDEGSSQRIKARPRRKATTSLLSQEAAPAEVVEGMAYTPDVIALAWEVARLFESKSPNPSRTVDTIQKIVRQFAEAVAGTKDAVQKLKDYYSLEDAEQWQREVEAGQRLAPGAAPLDVCRQLFSKSKRVLRVEPELPDAVAFYEAKMAEYQLKKEEEAANVSTVG